MYISFMRYNKRRGDLNTLAIWGLGATLLFGSCGGIGQACNNYEKSSGVRRGTIHKLSEKGIVWKTYEGQMALEGITQSGANVWNFSLDREAYNDEDIAQLAQDIRQYAETGTPVNVEYREPMRVWPWRADTRHLVQKVTPVNKAEK